MSNQRILFGWLVFFVWIKLLWLCWISNIFTGLIDSKSVKQDVSCTVILPHLVSVIWSNKLSISLSSVWIASKLEAKSAFDLQSRSILVQTTTENIEIQLGSSFFLWLSLSLSVLLFLLLFAKIVILTVYNINVELPLFLSQFW